MFVRDLQTCFIHAVILLQIGCGLNRKDKQDYSECIIRIQWFSYKIERNRTD